MLLIGDTLSKLCPANVRYSATLVQRQPVIQNDHAFATSATNLQFKLESGHLFGSVRVDRTDES